MDSAVIGLPRQTWGVAWSLGLMHALVDAACVCLLVWGNSVQPAAPGEIASHLSREAIWNRFLLFNTLAFATQFSIGAIADRFQAYRGTAVTGLLLTLLAMAIGPWAAMPAIIIAAFGNSAFHVGAGAIILELSPHRAAPAGIVVGPGAAGLAVGIWLGKAVGVGPWAFTIPLAIGAVVAWLLGQAKGKQGVARLRPISLGKTLAIACTAAIFLSIAIRSANGQAARVVHEGQVSLEWALAIGAALGNILGGFLADRFGWTKTCLLVLAISAPLLSFFVADNTAVVAGMILFQMTMPITLMALYRLFPREPGFAFGLGALAVLVGVVPVFVCPSEWITPPAVLLTLSLISIASLAFALPPVLRTEKIAGEKETGEGRLHRGLPPSVESTTSPASP